MMSTMQAATIVRWSKRLDAWLMNLAVLAMVGLIGYVMAAVVGMWLRWSVPDELMIVAECMVPIVFFPMAHLVAERGHLTVSLRIPPTFMGRHFLTLRDWLIWLLGLVFYTTVLGTALVAWLQAIQDGAYQMGVLSIPVAWSRSLLVIGVAAATLAQVLHMPTDTLLRARQVAE